MSLYGIGEPLGNLLLNYKWSPFALSDTAGDTFSVIAVFGNQNDNLKSCSSHTERV